ncbi:hypothetical protein SAMN05421780_10281 [Flexibacter flexilis DSM 6793]|uniref:Lipoprotein n=1 Tax=Flexibacter flexilis DSM 6793 TaxID=927664 RepID=A0A1I1F7K8_9BACT|nr:hypothetical protein [Flexibacter flexilis]SFB95264.1 hypothetical protein SAMN05421780_10281 [Flexibacter flexilis DSM 6793]
MRHYFYTLSWAVLCFVSSCQSKKNTKETLPPQKAFYHWKSNLQWQKSDSLFLEKLKVQKLYIRYFDVVWDAARAKAIPTAKVQMAHQPSDSINCIPVVYITVEAIRNTPDEAQAAALGQKIADKILAMHQRPHLTEIQIDCDWTASTQKRYFALLRAVRKQLSPKIQLSATVRLHQVKFYEKQGVPPTDRALIMCYNMASPAAIATKNSIFDKELCENYLQNLEEYPLPTDFALPLFSWGVVFRQKHFAGLINQLSDEELSENKAFTKKEDNWFEAKEAVFVRGIAVQAQDRIRADAVNLADLYAFEDFLKTKINTNLYTLSLYHYAPEVLSGFPPDSLQKIWR